MPDRLQRAILVGGCGLLLLGAAAGIWHFFAAQSPSSPLHFGGFAGPPWRLAFWSLLNGTLAIAFAWILPVAVPDPGSARTIAWIAAAGASLKTAGLLLGAVWQTYGRQVVDPRPKSLLVLVFRVLGDVVLVYVLARVTTGLARSLRRPP